MERLSAYLRRRTDIGRDIHRLHVPRPARIRRPHAVFLEVRPEKRPCAVVKGIALPHDECARPAHTEAESLVVRVNDEIEIDGIFRRFRRRIPGTDPGNARKIIGKQPRLERRRRALLHAVRVPDADGPVIFRGRTQRLPFIRDRGRIRAFHPSAVPDDLVAVLYGQLISRLSPARLIGLHFPAEPRRTVVDADGTHDAVHLQIIKFCFRIHPVPTLTARRSG